jgi:AmmeMemoRadiSam system protein B
VVNHHVLAADLIARFFKTLKASRPDITTFIILSPDHFSRGRGMSTSRLSYVTPAGTVDVAAFNVTSTALWDGTASRAFEQEHGVGALAPFVAREFPQAKIMPIFLRADVRPEDASDLGKALAASSDDKTFVIVSSDMSHFLREEDARAHDVDTIAWLKSGQWDELETATDKNTDSAVGLSVLHAYLDAESASVSRRFTLLSHKISTDYVADQINTTSYIVGFWE